MLIDHCYAFGLLLWPSGLKKKFFDEGGPSKKLYFKSLDVAMSDYNVQYSKCMMLILFALS